MERRRLRGRIRALFRGVCADVGQYLEAGPPRPDGRRLERRDRSVREPDPAAAAGEARREGLRGDAPAPRRLWPALRQRQAPRRRRRAPARLRRSPDQGLRDGVGCPRHAAHQDPLRRRLAGAARGAGRARGGVLGRDPAHHHAPGHPAPLRPHRGHAGPDAPARVGRHHHARGLRQLRAKHHRLPAGGRVPHRSLRRVALCFGDDALPARPSGRAGLRPQVQAGLLGLRARGLRPGEDARRRLRGEGRGRQARLPGGGRRRARSGAVPGRGAVRVHARGRAAARDAGGGARVRAARREAQPRPRAHQVPGGQARHRGVPAPGEGGAREAPLRPALDRVSLGHAEHHGRAGAACKGRSEVRRRRLRRLAREQRHAAAPAGLRRGDAGAAARRHHLGSDARARGHRAQVHGRQPPHDRRAEHLPALRVRGGPARALPGAEGRGSGGARRRHHRRRHVVPRHRHLQARHRGEPRARGRAAPAPRREVGVAADGREEPEDQDLRLLQQLRAAPRRRHRLLRQQPQGGRPHRAALPGDPRRPVDRERRLLRAGRRLGAQQGDPPDRSRRSPTPTRRSVRATSASRPSSRAWASAPCARSSSPS